MQVLQGALGASLTLLDLALGRAPRAPAPGAGASADVPDTAIWVYGANRWAPAEQDKHLARFAAIARRLYLSVEDGPRLLVDDPDGAWRLGKFLDRATGRFGHRDRDLTALRATIAEVTAHFGAKPGFRGIAIFAYDLVYDAPLVSFLEGRVVNASGNGVAGARLRAAGREVDTNRCGGFGFKGLPVERVDLDITARGYAPARVTVRRLVPRPWPRAWRSPRFRRRSSCSVHPSPTARPRRSSPGGAPIPPSVTRP